MADMGAPEVQGIAASGSRALGWVVLGSIGRVGGQLFVQISLARMLGPEAFGSFAAVLLLMGLGMLLADAGFGAALVHRPRIEDDDVRQALGWTLVLAVLLALAMALSAEAFAAHMGNPALAPMCLVAALLLVPAAVRNISLNLLQRRMDFKGLQLIDFIGYTVCFGGVALAAAHQGWGAWSLLAGFGAQVTFSLVATYLRCPHPLRPRLSGDRALAAFGLRAMSNDIVSWASENLDRLLIARLWGLHSLGLFVVSTNLARAPVGMLLASLRALAFSGSARAQGDRGAVAGGFLLTVEAALLATLPLFVLVSLEAEAVLALVYGETWRAAAPIMQAVSAAVPALVLSTLVAAILRGVGAVRTELQVVLTTTALLLLGLFALSRWPLSSVVWWFTMVFVLRMAWLLVAACKLTDVPARALVVALRPALMLACVAAAACVAARATSTHRADASDLVPLVAGILAAVGAAAAGSRHFVSPRMREWTSLSVSGLLAAVRSKPRSAVHGPLGDHAP